MSFLEFSNKFYNNLLGYIPEQTSLIKIPKKNWNTYTAQNNLNPNSSGIFLPRNQTAIIQQDNALSLFHEYFGHGVYCEQSLIGKKSVYFEKQLLKEEEIEFANRQFTMEDLQKFRQQSRTFKKLNKFKTQNLAQYELFAIWTEYLLSKELDLKEDFEIKYELIERKNRQAIDNIINFSMQYGDLATFYANGLARKTTAKRVKNLLKDIYGEELVNHSKLILLTGSKKLFSDIDLFASSNDLQSTKNDWLDLIVFNEEDFERRICLFEVQVTHPIMAGEFVAGDSDYLQQKRKQLQGQPITEEAINHNFNRAEKNKEYAERCKPNSEKWKASLSYAQTYLRNAIALKEGKRFFTKEKLEAVSF